MKTVNKQWIIDNTDEFLTNMRQGGLVIYPTDTIYGIGCDAYNSNSIEALRELKHRVQKPFSIIAPSKEWILQHFDVSPNNLDILPGPVTLILTPNDPSLFPQALNPGNSTVGVRIPDHWFSDIITQFDRPFVTTSVNISDEPHMATINDIAPSFQSAVSFCIYEGAIIGSSSTKIDLSRNKNKN